MNGTCDGGCGCSSPTCNSIAAALGVVVASVTEQVVVIIGGIVWAAVQCWCW